MCVCVCARVCTYHITADFLHRTPQILNPNFLFQIKEIS